MFKWLRRNRKKRQWKEFREWYQLHEQAKQFTFIKCPSCRFPAHNPEANYCSNCGTKLYAEPIQQQQDTQPGLYTTEPLQNVVAQRPFEAYRRQLQQAPMCEQQTQQVSAARPVGIKRTVHVPRLQRLA